MTPVTTVPHGTLRPPLENGRKTCSITLLYLSVTDRYEVIEIDDAACYKPGEWLTWETVIEICRSENWHVKMTSYELLSKLVNFIKPNIALPF
jgi:hypothetical protein